MSRLQLFVTPDGWCIGGEWTAQDIEQETLDGYRWFEAGDSYFRHFRPMPPNPQLDAYWTAHHAYWASRRTEWRAWQKAPE